MPDNRVELKLGEGGYSIPVDPAERAPTASTDRKDGRIDRLSMKAKTLQITTDGTLVGTTILVDGVQLAGVTRFELVAQKGYKKIAAVVEMTYDRDNIPEHGELAGQEVRGDDGVPRTVLVDVFRRR